MLLDGQTTQLDRLVKIIRPYPCYCVMNCTLPLFVVEVGIVEVEGCWLILQSQTLSWWIDGVIPLVLSHWCYPTGVIPLVLSHYVIAMYNISTVCSASQPSSFGGKDAPVKSCINSKIFRTSINLLFGTRVFCVSLCTWCCHSLKSKFFNRIENKTWSIK